jgi:hypothetical protein
MWIGDKHLDDLGAAALCVLDVESSRILPAAGEVITSVQIESRHLSYTRPGLSQKKMNSGSAGRVASVRAIKHDSRFAILIKDQGCSGPT